MSLFVVVNVAGPDRNHALGLRELPGWDEHAAFMDALVEDGFVLLGGPLGDGARALLVVEAADAQEIRTRLATDPWAQDGTLRIGSIDPWAIWLDGRPGASSGSGRHRPAGTSRASGSVG